MKINASKVLTNLEGKDYMQGEEKMTLGSVVAEALAANSVGGKMKLYTLAKSFYAGGEVEVDVADLSMICKAIESCASYNNLVLGQALLELENA